MRQELAYPTVVHFYTWLLQGAPRPRAAPPCARARAPRRQAAPEVARRGDACAQAACTRCLTQSSAPRRVREQFRLPQPLHRALPAARLRPRGHEPGAHAVPGARRRWARPAPGMTPGRRATGRPPARCAINASVLRLAARPRACPSSRPAAHDAPGSPPGGSCRCCASSSACSPTPASARAAPPPRSCALPPASCAGCSRGSPTPTAPSRRARRRPPRPAASLQARLLHMQGGLVPVRQLLTRP